MTDTVDIVPLADIKQHVRVDFDDDDAMLLAKMEAARQHLERWVGPLEDFEDGVPEDLKEAIRQHVARLYEVREPIGEGSESTLLPLGYFDLIDPWRGRVF